MRTSSRRATETGKGNYLKVKPGDDGASATKFELIKRYLELVQVLKIIAVADFLID